MSNRQKQIRHCDPANGIVLIRLPSLRQSIGIVPQAPILFDDSVMNNIRYARLAATDEEVYDSCRAAAIHDHILGFTEGYSTRVGERGV
jgi:ABC-type multidrug transport system fused ATPase/permease subunit